MEKLIINTNGIILSTIEYSTLYELEVIYQYDLSCIFGEKVIIP